VKDGAANEKVIKTDAGVGHEPKEKIKGKEEKQEPAGVENHLEIHIDEFGGRKIAREEKDRQEQQK
jgi:hypothetical protein